MAEDSAENTAEDVTAPRWQVNATTLTELFRAAASAHPDRLYCRTAETRLTYAAAAKAISALAEVLGPNVRGRTVALLLPNSPAFLIAYFGVLAAGAAPALVNHAHPDATVAKLLAGLDLAGVLTDREIPGVQTTPFDDAHVRELATGGAQISSGPDTSGDATGAILFSGGTTGLPKQIAHSARVLVRMAERMEWAFPTDDAEIWLPVAPFTHVWGFLMGVSNPLLRAGSLVIPPRFHPDLIVDMLARDKVTIFGGGPPAIYQALMSSDRFATSTFPALRTCPSGGAPVPLDVHRRWTEATGLAIMEAYGMTEIAPLSANTLSGGARPGSVGKAVPGTDIEIVDVETGRTVLPTGQTGEVRVKGPHMMRGYTGNPEETAMTIRDGYIYTGDIGRLDGEGFLTISDRKKDVIFVKGFNVFPRELEEALLAHDAVSGACVVGRPDARAGEVPVAYVTLRIPVAPEDLKAFCARTLAAYKLPAEIIALDSLPLTPAGKLNRALLRKQASERPSSII